MASGGEGYFHASYFHASYWHNEYWAEQSPAVGAGAPGGGMNVAVLEELLKTAIIMAFVMVIL